jgi:hypothetical protein
VSSGTTITIAAASIKLLSGATSQRERPVHLMVTTSEVEPSNGQGDGDDVTLHLQRRAQVRP